MSSTELSGAIRALRADLKITQIELARKVDVTSTSIYRYEAGSRLPGLGSLVSLWHFAVTSGSATVTAFAEALMAKIPALRPVLETLPRDQERYQEQYVNEERLRLRPSDRILVLAIINMLAGSQLDPIGPTRRRIIETLVEPWMKDAKAAAVRV